MVTKLMFVVVRSVLLFIKTLIPVKTFPETSNTLSVINYIHFK